MGEQVETGEAAAEEEGEDDGQEIDAFDLLEAQEVVSKLPKDFYRNIVSTCRSRCVERKVAVIPLLSIFLFIRLFKTITFEVVRT